MTVKLKPLSPETIQALELAKECRRLDNECDVLIKKETKAIEAMHAEQAEIKKRKQVFLDKRKVVKQQLDIVKVTVPEEERAEFNRQIAPDTTNQFAQSSIPAYISMRSR